MEQGDLSLQIDPKMKEGCREGLTKIVMMMTDKIGDVCHVYSNTEKITST